jgi:hypothetical protein
MSAVVVAVCLLRFSIVTVVEAVVVAISVTSVEVLDVATKALTGLTVAVSGVAALTTPPVRMSKPMSVCKISRFLTCNMHV